MDGRNKASVGTFCLDHNACGWSIEEMSNEHGGVCQPFGYRSMTSGELAVVLDAILSAIEITQKQFGLEVSTQMENNPAFRDLLQDDQ